MASSAAANGKVPAWTTKDRSWLVPWNRKLRHLRSIALRNLALEQKSGRARARTIDDDALPNTLKSPAKLLALRESKALEHSRSSEDLRPIHEDAISNQEKVNSGPKRLTRTGSKSGRGRPGMPKLRRRSTLDWNSGSPHQRQKRLEDVSAARMADVFFTLHVEGIPEPIYVSETVPKTMNPDFEDIELEGCGPAILRAESLTVKFWVKSQRMQKYAVLLEMTLSLQSLQFIGKELSHFSHPLPQNCAIFQLPDGLYTCFTDAQVEQPPYPFPERSNKDTSSRQLPTASYDALLRLSKLDDSIQDAVALRDRLKGELEGLVKENREPTRRENLLGETKDYLKTVKYARATVEKQLQSLRKTRDQRQASLQARRNILRDGRDRQKQSIHEMSQASQDSEHQRAQRTDLRTDMFQQRRRICDDLQKVYSIKPVPDKPLAFAIRGVYLPDSEQLDSVPPDTVAAALGHAAHAVQLLSFYLNQPLPYVLHLRSSTSSVSDSISLMKPGVASSAADHTINALKDPSRQFPLFPKGGPRFRFEYGVFLINKDIELLLSNAFQVRVLDIRQTLPNLLYALYCATAGEGELPARKAGGVRGLLRAGKGGGTSMPGSRTASIDSTNNSILSGSTLGKGSNGKPVGGNAYKSLARNQEEQDKKANGRS